MKKIKFIYGLLIAIVLIFSYRLYTIQLKSDVYKIRAESVSLKKRRNIPDRGYVFDRNGKLLVTNKSNYEVTVVPKEILKDFDTLSFCKLTNISKEYFIKNVKKAKQYSYYLPSPFLKNVSKIRQGIIREKIHNFSGFSIHKKPVRNYKINSSSSILGYLGVINDKQIKTSGVNYQKGDYVGKKGVEKSYENILRGTFGIQYLERDFHQRTIGSYKNGVYDTLPKAGKDITLTIDYDLQQFTEELLQNKRGAAVAIDIKTGEILAMVTSPNVNPKLLSIEQRGVNYDSLIKHEDKPLFNRAVIGAYPPGSPFKLLTALVAKQEGVITDSTRYVCRHGYVYGRRRIGCHCGHYYYGIGLETAIAKSCNNYFTSAYRDIIKKYKTPQIGVQKWAEHLHSFGLGKFLGNDLDTGSKGNIPDSTYYNKWYGKSKWGFSQMMFNGMGQGEVLLTPIQMANFTAIIANKGYYYTPHIVKKIGDKPIDDKNFTVPKQTTIDSKHFDEVIEGMYKVYTIGTARRFRNREITMCGKTGTSQVSIGQDHSLFTAFGPKKNPQIAVAVVIENGHYGATWAGPIASLIIEKHLNKKIKGKRSQYLVQKMKKGNLRKEYNNVKRIRTEINRRRIIKDSLKKINYANE